MSRASVATSAATAPARAGRAYSAETEATLEAMRAMVESGNAEWQSLPPHAFRSPEIFELEKEKIFRAGWVLIGRADQVSKPGDYLTADVVGEPLVMLRDRDGELRVLSRVCRHRWMEVCTGSGNAKWLTCPYHAWVYNLDGTLRGAPGMDETPGFDKADIRLASIRHEVWQGFVYVNLDGHAEPLEPRLAPLAAELKEFNLPEWRVVKSQDFGELPWDWKVFQDNGDCYHHIGIHRGTFERDYPGLGAWDSPNNGHYTLIWCRAGENNIVTGPDGLPVIRTLFKPLTGLTENQRLNLCLFYVLPNFWVFPSPDLGLYMRVFPLGPGRLHMTLEYMVPPHVLEDPEFTQKLGEIEKYAELFNGEDTRVCAAVQRGLESEHATSGKYSKLEGHNRDYALWVARQLTA
ncbi:MAG: aromatic ring-hydroxylating dioxygenase subunit alpha [Candidatus Binatia bacterium]